MGALALMFAGLVGELELAAVSVGNSVIGGLAFGIIVLFYYLYCYVYTLFLSFILALVVYFVFWMLHGPQITLGSSLKKRTKTEP